VTLIAIAAIAGGAPLSAGATSAGGAVPLGVDARVLAAPTHGVHIGKGQLSDAAGRAVNGRVAILAWPGETFLRSLRDGVVFATPTVGWARTAADGRWSADANPTLIPREYVEPDGKVNFVAIGWTSMAQGRWDFSAWLGANASRNDATDLSFSANGKLDTGAALLRTSVRSTQRDPSPELGIPICGYGRVGTYQVWSIVNESWPYGSDKGWLHHESSHSVTVGSAMSTDGGLHFSVSGSSTTTAGVSFTYAKSIAYRDFRVGMQYGKFRQYCGGQPTNTYSFRVDFPNGGYDDVGRSGVPNWTYCLTVSAGEWVRNRTDGSAWSFSAGTKVAGVIGIDLSSSTNYSTTLDLHYELVAKGLVCGSNAVPSIAAKVKTSR
jgi:hypothetical protein